MFIQTLVVNNKVDLIDSFVLHEEISAITHDEKRGLILTFLGNANIYVAKDKQNEVLQLASEIMQTGIKYMDSAHIACAIIAKCDYLISTDKRMLKYNSNQIKLINPIDFIRVWEDKNDG